MIKFLDLAAQNQEIMPDVERRFAQIHERTAYVDGPQVSEFERAFASYLGTRHAVGVGSGTDALRLALMGLGIGAGDEVITIPSTFIATAASVIHTGATPSFVDIDPLTGTMNPQALSDYLAKGEFKSQNGPRAILPVHLYGLPAAIDDIRDIAQSYGLSVVEDACQAHGARVENVGGWKMAGTIGDAGCFSFYPGKNLGAWGEAGAVVTDDDGLAERVLRLRNHGRLSHFAHQDCGYNARLDTMQAAVLNAKLQRLPAWNARRRQIASAYNQLLATCDVQTPEEPVGNESSYHLYVIRSPKRDAVRQALMEKKIECGIHYPVPLHLQPALRSLGYGAGDFPLSELWADSILSLPMHPHMLDSEIQEVADAVRSCVGSGVKTPAGERVHISTAIESPDRAAD
jgi:dTDP-4-amino-4,6-dideoxygalactose transaminase